MLPSRKVDPGPPRSVWFRQPCADDPGLDVPSVQRRFGSFDGDRPAGSHEIGPGFCSPRSAKRAHFGSSGRFQAGHTAIRAEPARRAAPSPSRAPLEPPLAPSQSLAPSTPESQPANPFAEASLNSDPLALSPNMIGDFFGSGTGVISGVPVTIPGSEARFRPVQIPDPAASVLGTLKVADDSSPLPRDRVFCDYDFFNDVPFVPGGIDVNRFLFGVEKTFFDGRCSLEVRIPFGSSLTDNLTTQINTTTFAQTTPVEDEFQLGNVTLGADARPCSIGTILWPSRAGCLSPRRRQAT